MDPYLNNCTINLIALISSSTMHRWLQIIKTDNNNQLLGRHSPLINSTANRPLQSICFI